MRWGDLTDGKREAPEPLEGNVVATVLTGTVVWAVLFVAQAPFWGWYADRGHAWWLWTCLAGTGLGLFGLWFVRRREAALARDRDTGDGGRPD
ncbi:DUF2530 domain-containing protein [Streptomyces marincola]|uniref:DUF2530 domain-containing protein n=1 Tax=Streptomyces marincola TaxID=2878388 RepID=A0A1W7CZ48_9ACTN|nr:DUF2530 domain-containing protein [Streptomyces marincola]ARQ70121.1 DUF2530 domain-containing protein [Streptomyces marincola]